MKESFEDFKRLIKEWLDTHPKEYGSFIEEMNCKNSAGFQKVFMLVIKYVPKYKVVSKKVCKLDIILIFALSNKKQQEYGTYTRTNFGNYFELHK